MAVESGAFALILPLHVIVAVAVHALIASASW
jgi:hypothetical protein